jgi:sugar lactone lactonase YvrE
MVELCMMNRLSSSVCAFALLCGTMSSAADVEVVLDRRAGEIEEPFGVDFDQDGTLYFVELTKSRIKRVSKNGAIETIGGSGEKGDAGDGGNAKNAAFNGPHSLAFGPDANLYIADTWNNRVRRIDTKTGLVHAFAGTGKKGFAGDGGPAAKAEFGGIFAIAFDPQRETMYLADLDNRRIRAIDLASGVVRTVAGNGEKGLPKDGQTAVSQPLVDPRAVAADAIGNVYILERGGHALRVVDSEGRIRTVAGTGKAGQGDDGPALQVAMNGPKHLCIDRDNSVIIADAENHRIVRYVPAESRVVRIAGTGRKGSRLDASPLQTELNRPHGVTVDREGILFVTDSYNNRILKISH